MLFKKKNKNSPPKNQIQYLNNDNNDKKQQMILTDGDILKEIERGTIVIRPFKRESLGSNSYDVHLGNRLAIYRDKVLDARAKNEVDMFEIDEEEGFVLQPGELYLGSTLEYTETMAHVPFLEGKSSTGRLGICIHLTAGVGDVGFQGNWTLEISVAKPVRVYRGMPIGQLLFFETNMSTLLTPYHKKKSAKYNRQPADPVPSRMHENSF